MKKIDFRTLHVETSIDTFESMDLRKQIGNTIHRNAASVPMADLAREIYHSDGLVCISDDDYDAMLAIIEKSYALLVVDAVRKGAENTKEVEEERHD